MMDAPAPASAPASATPPTASHVDPVTLDIIENALKNARFEMDERRAAASRCRRSSASSTTNSR